MMERDKLAERIVFLLQEKDRLAQLQARLVKSGLRLMDDLDDYKNKCNHLNKDAPLNSVCEDCNGTRD